MSNSNHTKLSRRALLKASAGASALGILGAPAIVSRANAQSKFDWKRFKGEKIEVMLVKNPRADLLQSARRNSRTSPGITVSSEQIPEQQQRQKAMIEFTSGRPTFDVTHARPARPEAPVRQGQVDGATCAPCIAERRR